MSLLLSKGTKLCTLICQKLILICFYYFRCFGAVTYCISKSNLYASPKGVAFRAYEHKSLMCLTIGLRSLCSLLFYYASFVIWTSEVVLFRNLTVVHLTFLVFCTLSNVMTQIWCSKRSVIAIHNLFKVIHCVRQLHPNYEIFQMSHLVLLAVKIMCIIFEIGWIVLGVLKSSTLSGVVMNLGYTYLMIGVCLNLHIACLLYVFIDALFGVYNHYVSSSFLGKLKMVQESKNNSFPPEKMKRLILDLEQSLQIYYDIHRVGQEIQSILQIPIVNTLLFIYTATISIVYYMVYFRKNIVLWYYVPFILKLSVDIGVLSLAAHKAIKSSQIVRRIGFENIILPENRKWHRNMELFLYNINLYDFKLNILGLFDITNALTLTYIAGILTALTIFIPFSIEAFKMKEILEAN